MPAYNPATPVPGATSVPVRQAFPSVAGVRIDGLTEREAIAKLQRVLGPKVNTSVYLTDGVRTYAMARSALGASIPFWSLVRQARELRGDVPLTFVVDTAQAERVLRGLATRINRDASPVGLDVENGRVVLLGGDGVRLAVTGSALRVKQALESSPPLQQVELVVARISGAVPEATLAQFTSLLAEFSTPYDARLRGRTNNLRIAASHVNGTIVPSGEVFSANRAIGPRDTGEGWREAQMFVSGQVVTGVGAGICQCATTLYNAALLAGLPVVERHPHMFHVSYAPPSRDATLYWGSKDLRFRNTTSGPIYVQTFLRGGRFHARLYGVEPVGRKIAVEARTLSRRNGIRSEAYRIVYSDDGAQRELLSRDYYKPHP